MKLCHATNFQYSNTLQFIGEALQAATFVEE